MERLREITDKIQGNPPLVFLLLGLMFVLPVVGILMIDFENGGFRSWRCLLTSLLFACTLWLLIVMEGLNKHGMLPK